MSSPTTPTLRNAGTVGSGASGGTSLNLTTPACSVGDLLFATIIAPGGASCPGWSLVQAVQQGTGGDALWLTVLTRFAVAGDSGHVFTFTLNASGTGKAPTGVIDDWQDVFAIEHAAVANSTTAPQLVTGRANERIIEVWTANRSQTLAVPPTIIHAVAGTSTTGPLAVSSQTQTSPGTTAAQTAMGGTSTVAITVSMYGSTPPNAPTLNSPPTGTTLDETSTQRFTWTFSDDDPGDSQSAFDLRYSNNSGASWTTISQTTPNQFLDIAAGTFTTGSYEWQVRTYDAYGVVGAWSPSSFFTAAVPPPGPAITAPTSGSTIGDTPATVSWSATSQQAYQIRRVADLSGSPDTSTVYFDTGQINSTTIRSAAVPFETNGRSEHVQVRVEASGLWSPWSDVRVNVSYNTPPAPSLFLTEIATRPAQQTQPDSITITYTTPAPTTIILPGSLLGPTQLTAPTQVSTLNPTTTGSFTAPAGELTLVRVTACATSGGLPTFNITDTFGGLGWTRLAANNGTSAFTADIWFYAVGNGATGTVTITPTISSGANPSMTIDVYGVTGQSGIGATGSSTSLTVTLNAAPDAASMVIASLAQRFSSDPGNSAPPGMTALITDRHTLNDLYDTVAYQNRSAGQSMTFGGTPANPTGHAFEIVAAPISVTQDPAVYVDIYRSADGGMTSERVATLLPITGAWTDYTPASGVDYSYQVLTVAANGVTTASGWVSGDVTFPAGDFIDAGPYNPPLTDVLDAGAPSSSITDLIDGGTP